MTDAIPSSSSVVNDLFDGSRLCASLSPADAVASAALPTHEHPAMLFPSATFLEAQAGPPFASGAFVPGKVRMNTATLRRLRESRLLSQQDLADDFWRLNIRVSIATIKRAETGHDVRFRICRELARYYSVSFDDLLR